MASCSSVESPGFLAFPPRFLGARPTRLREPLAYLKMNVSSASTMPRVEGALARLAHVALETGGRAPWLEVGRAAMTTRRRRREPRLDQSDNLLARARRRQRLDKCFALNLAEFPQLFD